MEYKVEMPYIGGVISKNDFKWGRGTKKEVKFWMGELAGKVRELGIPKFFKYEVGIFGKFHDERRPDMQNLFEVVSDAVEDGLGVNDKNFIIADDGYSVGWERPILVIRIRGYEKKWLT